MTGVEVKIAAQEALSCALGSVHGLPPREIEGETTCAGHPVRRAVWSLDERKRRVARPVTQVFPSGRQEAFTLRWPPAVKWRQLPTVIS